MPTPKMDRYTPNVLVLWVWAFTPWHSVCYQGRAKACTSHQGLSVLARRALDALGATAAARARGTKIREEHPVSSAFSLYVRMRVPCAKMAVGDRTTFGRGSEHANTTAHGAYEPRGSAANT